MELALVVHLLVVITIYGILAISLNLVVGATGLFNLGHAAFYGIGAYTSALLVKAGVPWLLAVLASMAMAGFVAFIIGIPTLRLVGDYLAVVTMGLGEITRAVFKNWISLTRGPMGLPGIPHASILGIEFDTADKYLILGIICLLITFVVAERILYSPFGRVLKGIREDEAAVQALGKNTYRYKMAVLVVGSAMAGLAGSLFAHYITFIDPSSFVMWLTFFIFLIIVLGGLGNNLGAVVVTVVFVALREGLRFVGLPLWLNPAALQQLIFGILLIIATIFVPRGLIPERKVVYE
ncbi:MAG: branched-chain amino acid ABC transporter permease [Ardenticatenia bacterium]|jgi:branched-chain amino acid transport system permease protein|nr:MAG: branched-chain amino acid ABC transporter permease [Ardenticatenia bacterium]